MAFRVATAFLILSTVCTTLARAQNAPTTPTEVGLAFTKAVAAGDAATARSLATGAETDMAVVDAMAEMVQAMQKLASAATAKFGADAAELAAMNPAQRIAGQFANAQERKIDDTSVALVSPGAASPLRLKKVNGAWRVDLAAMMSPEDARKAIPLFKRTTKAAGEVADDIAQDKYKTAAEAQKAFGAKADPPLAPPADK